MQFAKAPFGNSADAIEILRTRAPTGLDGIGWVKTGDQENSDAANEQHLGAAIEIMAWAPQHISNAFS